ncbi:MAG: alanine:cation symporter family protein, partial [Lachnospiraceae bacterium]|nr:alanine:cation symporter family protein [Lachnospiraceae bacterium]
MFFSVVNQNYLLGLVSKVNGFMWDFLLLILLCGTGVYYSFRTGFIQVRKFKEAFKATFGGISLKGEKAGKDGMSSFQSLATSLAAQVGTGNLAGAATAIATGGPGAIFW